MTPGRWLCSRCGSTAHEEVSATELRCSECGHGASFQPLTKHSDEHLSDEQPESVAVRAAVDAMRRMVEQPEQAFLDAPFAPFGLDERWKGLRWFGGQGDSESEIDRLELAHCDDPLDEAKAQIRVETRRPQRIGFTDHRDPAHERWVLARELVERFWHLTDRLPDEIRAAAFPNGAEANDPTTPWADAMIPVDGTAVGFKVLAKEEVWVALAEHGDVFIAIEARGWPVAETGLVSVTDLTPYEAGSNAIRMQNPGALQP